MMSLEKLGRRGLFLVAGFLLAVVSFNPSAEAIGPEEGTLEAGPYGGYAILDDYGNTNPKNGPLFGGRVGYFITDNTSFETSYQYIKTKHTSGPFTVSGNISTLGVNYLYNFLKGSAFRPFVTLGLGWKRTNFDVTTIETNDLGVNVGGGLRYFFNDWIGARIDGRYVASEVSGPVQAYQHDFEGTGGVTFLFQVTGKDADSDGVKDDKDQCPGTPAGADVDGKGCPTDADSDGVYDGLDKCANTPAGAKVDGQGCPMDSDMDGVVDGIDQCEGTPKGLEVGENGCPKDDDNDGVPNHKDKCPMSPKGVAVDKTGCVADDDQDGVANDKDRCANTPKGKKVDAKGCPEVSIARGILKGVNFRSGSAKLTKGSYKTLDNVARELNKFPKVKVEVQGHTDNTGSLKTNMRLSKLRAQSVADYLMGKGVKGDRLRVRGYGPSNPIADNKTRSGRKANRRVEVQWLE